MSLTEFLLARIAEDEATARAAGIPAHDGYKPHGELLAWRYADGGEVEFDYDDPSRHPSKFYVTCDGEGLSPAVEPSTGRHIARWSPARVLAECEAKRRIVDMHAFHGDDCAGHPGPWMPHDDYGTGYCKRGDEDHYELRWLALPYAEHPDYRSEWSPV